MLKTLEHRDWNTAFSTPEQESAIAALERGEVVFFPHLAFDFHPHERSFFTANHSTKRAKNISYNAKNRTIRGANCPEAIQQQYQVMMQRYVDATENLMQALFPSYTARLQTGRTSFRPVEIAGRIPKSIRKDDTKLHVDAFPTSPTQGNRIIRVFTNVNPNQKPRAWRLGEPFAQVAERFLPQVKRPWPGRGMLLKTLRITRGYATEYDYTMLQLHHLMKSDPAYQKQVSQQEVLFAPGCTWIVILRSSVACSPCRSAFARTDVLSACECSGPTQSIHPSKH